MKQVINPVTFLVIIALLLSPPQSHAQSAFPGLPALTPAYVNNFSANNNLPQACVSDVLMDHKGRLWVATCQAIAGLNSVRLLQFDGYDFCPVNLANASLPNRTMAILKGTTRSGEILGFLETAKINSIFLFDPERQTTQTISFHAQTEGELKDLVLRADESILALTYKLDSVFLYQLRWPNDKQLIKAWKVPMKQREFGYFDFSLYDAGDEVLIISNDPPAIFQVGIKDRSCRTHPFGGTFLREPLSFTLESFNDRFYKGFIPSPTGELFCFVSQAKPQVYVRQAPGEAFEALQGLPADHIVLRMEQDAVGNILFLMLNRQEQYVALLRDRQGQFYDYTAFVSGRSRIHNIRSRNFFQAVFICSEDGFFYQTTSGNEDVHCLLTDYGIRAMMEVEPGRFLITTESSPPALYEKASGKTTFLDSRSPLYRAFGKSSIRKFMRASDGAIWSFRIDTLVRYDPVSGLHRDYAVFNQTINYEMLSDGRIAYCTLQNQQLYFFDPATGKSTPWKANADMQSMKGFVHDIRQTKDGTVWVLTTNGLTRLNLSTGEESLMGFQAPFRDFRFLCMAEAPDGKMWFGTFLGGIHIYDPANGTVQIVDKSQGMPSNTIAFILPDGSGNFLAGTYHGLSYLSADGVVCSNFFREEGLCELEFNRYAALKAGDGSFLLGSLQGVHVVSPDLLKRKNFSDTAPRVFLTSFSITDPGTGNNITYREDLEKLPLLVLPPEHRNLLVRFALSSYVQPERNQFAYMLEGLDKNWTHIGSQHELNLSNLPPGRYTLLIKGCDFQGNCATAPIRIPIHAREFFYKQAWFYLVCTLPFLVFGLIWLRRLRSEKKRLENEVQKRTQQIQRDKTLIEQQARELLQLDEAKSRFFTNISHELRTPITLITAPVERLIQKFYPNADERDEERQALKWVLYNGQKLGALVEELLELSRLEAGKTELLETPTPFYSWCRQIFSAFESQAEMKKIRYELHYQADENLLLAIDRKRLEKIINNLISNALKFTGPGGEVKVSVSGKPAASKQSVGITIRVADTGRGISAEDIPHVFERYFQTKRNDVVREGGTGIGLALAKELAQLMNGKLDVESEPGKGSVFTLSLSLKKTVEAGIPLPAPAVEPEEILEQTKFSPVAGEDRTDRKEHILIVEDNPNMQALLHSLLSDDYQLTIANDGQEAWDLLEAKKTQDISLILSDVMMPRMDGYALLEKIKSQEQWRQTPFILLTARAEQDDKIQALRLGVDDYLVKPFSPTELLARVSNLIANYQSRRSFSGKVPPVISFEKVESQDDLWLKNIEIAAKTALDKGLSLQVGYLAEAGVMSERQFFREIKRLTGLTPNQYIQEVRLQKARHLLQHRAYHTLAEVAYAVGFETPTYFTRVFEQHFGKHPSAYLELALVSE